MRIQPILLVGVTLFVLSCSNEQRGESDRQFGHSEETGKVEKWKIDSEIGKKVLDMRVVIEDFHQNKDDAPNYQELGNILNKNIEEIFSSCTMPSGPAHDAFHTYISQVIAHVKELRNEENNTPEDTLTKLKDHLASFLDVFESA